MCGGGSCQAEADASCGPSRHVGAWDGARGWTGGGASARSLAWTKGRVSADAIGPDRIGDGAASPLRTSRPDVRLANLALLIFYHSYRKCRRGGARTLRYGAPGRRIGQSRADALGDPFPTCALSSPHLHSSLPHAVH